MKITGVKLTPIRTPRHSGYACRHVVVELYSDEGITGYGEMSDLSHMPLMMPDVTELEKSLNGILTGRDPRQLAVLESDLNKFFTRGAGEKCGAIKAGIDIAAHDLVGKLYGVSASELLGGRFRDRIKVCYPIFRHRTMQDVATNLERVARFNRLGFDVFRLYVGINFEADEAFLAGVRSRFGNAITIKSLDFSALVPWKSAVAFIKRVMPYGFTLVESPALGRDPAALREVRRHVDVPVSEHAHGLEGLLEFIRNDSIDIANISVTGFGGLISARRAFAVCEAANVQCLIGTTQELSLATAAQAHLGASVPNLEYVSDPTGPHVYAADITVEPVQYENGFLLVPTGPGIGVELDLKKVSALAAPLGWDGQSARSILDRTVDPEPEQGK